MNMKHYVFWVVCAVFLPMQCMDSSSLWSEIAAGNLKKVQEILDKGTIGVTVRGKLNITPLHAAVAAGRPKIVTYLLEKNADPHLKDDKGDTPLHTLVQATGLSFETQKALADALLKKGVALDEQNKVRLTPLWLASGQLSGFLREKEKEVAAARNAAKSGDLKAIKELVKEKGVSPNQKYISQKSLLHYAVDAARPQIVEFLLAEGADINAKDDTGKTPLHELGNDISTKSADRLAIAKKLVESGANVKAQDNDGETVLFGLLDPENIELLKFFEQKGANVKHVNKKGQTLLHYAARGGVESARFLLEKKVDPTLKDTSGNTPLHELAAMEGLPFETQKAIAEAFLNNGASIDKNNKKYEVPLYVALDKKNFDLAKFLIEKGADTSKSNFPAKTTILHKAVEQGNSEIVKLLLEKKVKVDVNAKDNSQRTPLFKAIEQGNSEIVKLLLEKNADPNVKDWLGTTPLLFAAEEKNVDAMKLLIDYGADTAVTTIDGKSPFDLLERSDCTKILDYIEQKALQQKKALQNLAEALALLNT